MRRISLSVVLSLGACGGAAIPRLDPPKDPLSAPAAPVATALPVGEVRQVDEARTLPVECPTEGACTMPRAFVQRLCAGAYPDLALLFFAKGSPWRRAYVSVRHVVAFNGIGGPSSDEQLTFDEELIVLSERKADTLGMQVSGAGDSYDALRWDGTCATVSAEEIRFVAPPKPGHASIRWRALSDGSQNALLQDAAVSKTSAERRKECKGATIGDVTARCEKADRRLNDLIVEAVRSGTTVPRPEKLP